jgi:multiple sugar transport system permease protein
MGRVKKQIKGGAFAVLVIALSLVFLSPFVVMVTTSFKTMEDAFMVPVKILPREFTIKNYGAAVAKIPYFKYMANTAFITGLSLLGELLVVPMVAYSLARIKWKGAKLLSGLLMATMMIPYTVTMIPLYRTWHALGLTKTYVPLIAPHFVGHAYYIIILRQFMIGLPNSLFEAAKIDGAKEFHRYLYLALPLCKPALTTVGIYTFIAAWSDYLGPLIYINKKDRMTLSLGLQQFLNEYTVDWTLLMAAAVIFVIPVIVLFFIFQRNFVEGVSTAGLKA